MRLFQIYCINWQSTKYKIYEYKSNITELNQCEENPCHNNGVCNNTNEGKGYTCNCTGYYGERHCDTGNSIK